MLGQRGDEKFTWTDVKLDHSLDQSWTVQYIECTKRKFAQYLFGEGP